MSNASDFVIKNGILKKYIGQNADVTIPSEVTKIEDHAFFGCKKLQSVVIHGNVTNIGNGTFLGCSGLKSVRLSEGVSIIGYEAFADCTELRNVELPESLTEIWWGAFRGCRSLVSITIPKGVSKISWRMFEDCCNLTSVNIQNSEARFDDWAFDRRCSGLANKSGQVIVNGILFAYRGSGGEVIIPGTVFRIAEYAFSNCPTITDVTIQEGVAEVGEKAFRNCAKLQVTLPDSLRKVKPAFSGCSCKVKVRRWSSVINRLMSDCTLLEVDADDYSAFPPDDLLSRAIQISKTDDWNPSEKNEKAMLDALKKNAGKICNSVIGNAEKLNFLCENKLIQAKDVDLYLNEVEKTRNTESKALLLNYQNELGQEKITKAREKKEKVKENYSDALIERIATRDPSKGIEGMTFVITGKLSNVWKSRVEVKEYLESYGARLGSSITKQTDYLVANDTESNSEKNRKAKEYGAQIINEIDFNDIIGRKFKDVPHKDIPEWLRTISEEAFMNCSKLVTVEIPNCITEIGDSAFKACRNLNNVTIPDSATSIGNAAFQGCHNLRNVIIPKGVTNVGKSAFQYCRALTSVMIPETGMKIGELAFDGCRGLTDRDGFVIVEKCLYNYYGNETTVRIPEGVAKIGTHAFYLNNDITDIIVPDGVFFIGAGAFQGCSNLRSIILPESVSHIGVGAFLYTPLYDEKKRWENGGLYIGKNLIEVLSNYSGSYDVKTGTQYIAEGAFWRCDKLKSVTIPGSVTAIGQLAFGLIARTSIHAPAGSYAEQYAKEQDIPFIAE